MLAEPCPATPRAVRICLKWPSFHRVRHSSEQADPPADLQNAKRRDRSGTLRPDGSRHVGSICGCRTRTTADRLARLRRRAVGALVPLMPSGAPRILRPSRSHQILLSGWRPRSAQISPCNVPSNLSVARALSSRPSFSGRRICPMASLALPCTRSRRRARTPPRGNVPERQGRRFPEERLPGTNTQFCALVENPTFPATLVL